MSDPAAHDVLRLAPEDNVVIAVRALGPGEVVQLDGVAVAVVGEAPLGFKLAALDLPDGTVVVRANVPIGRTTAPVAAGEVVHTHNLESLYLRTHARGED